MDPYTKDLFQVIAWGVASVGGVVAAFLAIREAHKKTTQRKEELRWNRAKLGMEMLDKLKANPKARAAMIMLDWEGLEYDIGNKKKATIQDADIWNALRTTNTEFNDTEVFIRDCFDEFFDELERIETSLQAELIEFSDIKNQIQYYVDNLLKNKPVYTQFLKSYRFKLAPVFLERFDNWSKT